MAKRIKMKELLKENFSGTMLGGVVSRNAFSDDFTLSKIVKEKYGEIGEEELKNAKNYLINSYVLRLDSNKKVASILLNTQMDGLSTDFFEKRNDYINSVSLKDIKKIASKIVIK